MIVRSLPGTQDWETILTLIFRLACGGNLHGYLTTRARGPAKHLNDSWGCPGLARFLFSPKTCFWLGRGCSWVARTFARFWRRVEMSLTTEDWPQKTRSRFPIRNRKSEMARSYASVTHITYNLPAAYYSLSACLRAGSCVSRLPLALW